MTENRATGESNLLDWPLKIVFSRIVLRHCGPAHRPHAAQEAGSGGCQSHVSPLPTFSAACLQTGKDTLRCLSTHQLEQYRVMLGKQAGKNCQCFSLAAAAFQLLFDGDDTGTVQRGEGKALPHISLLWVCRMSSVAQHAELIGSDVTSLPDWPLTTQPGVMQPPGYP